MAWPGSGQPIWALQLIALAVGAWTVLRATSATQAFLRAGLYAAFAIGATVWWLFIAMHTYGGLAAPLALLALAVMAILLALPYGAFCALWWNSAPRQSPTAAAAWFGLCWMAAELLRGMGWWGFGWGAAGYAHVEGPLAGYAPWIGVDGIDLLAAALAMALALGANALLQRGRPALGPGLLIVAIIALPPALRPLLGDPTSPTGRLDVALLQGNIPQNEKFEAGLGVPMALQWYGDMLEANARRLVVAPETALPVLPYQLPPGYLDALQARYADGRQLAIVGVPLGSHREGYTNSAVALGPAGAAWRYDKHHLVPFGEITPWGLHWFTRLMDIPLSDFRAGDLVQPSLSWQGQRLGVNICYEDLFGEELAARFADADAAPTLFVNLSNIAWFGEGAAIDQHLSITRMRALELARPFVRATNTGATAIVGADGVVQALLPRATRGVLEGTVEGRTGRTPYARWMSHTGLGAWWALWALAAAGLWWRRRRAGTP